MAEKISKRDALWNLTFETYYDSYYYETLAGSMARRWQFFDDISKVIIATTATGSVIAGWTLWNEPNFKNIWAIAAGVGSLLAVIHSTLTVSRRIQDWEEARQNFQTIRIDFETLRQTMEMDRKFSLKSARSKFLFLREKYKDTLPRIKNDTLTTKRLKLKVQDVLDGRLENAILQRKD